MTHHHHSDGPFDADDPMSMMGIAMVGMALEQMAEREERAERARSYPAQPPQEIRWDFVIGAVVIIGGLVLLCGWVPALANAPW